MRAVFFSLFLSLLFLLLLARNEFTANSWLSGWLVAGTRWAGTNYTYTHIYTLV